MQKLISNMVIILTILVVSALAYADSPVAGLWHTPGKEGVVEIKISDEVLSGKLVASTNERAKLGTMILRDFVRNGNAWNGSIYAPKLDRTLKAELSLSDDKLTIKVFAGLRKETVIWTRTKLDPAGPGASE